MASKSTVNKMKHIQKLVDKYADKRKELKEAGDYEALAKLPRNSSPTRYRNYCKLTGRTRGYYRKFGLSRIMIRELAAQGMIPGLKKSSW
ncbi:SSU ribosomal protein S14P [Planctomycetales bacterium 10988]|nr:SSU ribosomal protein S14P [Planctomycetales bacterium 10988]